MALFVGFALKEFSLPEKEGEDFIVNSADLTIFLAICLALILTVSIIPIILLPIGRKSHSEFVGSLQKREIQMVKMVDVAKHAGVSVKTVSRVLNNEPHVQDKLRSRVFASVKTLGYVPSASARNLRSSRTYTLHLIAHAHTSNYINAIQAGALMASQKMGYNLIWTFLDPSLAQQPDNLKTWCDELARKMKPDGIILVPPYTNHEAVNAHFRTHNIPIIRIGPNNILDHHVTVKIDEKGAARKATQYLIELGHRRIAFIRGLEDQTATQQRFKGYCEALSEADIAFDADIVFPGEFSFVSGMTAGEKIVSMQDRPSAVFAANDDMAAGVIVAAHKNQIRIPEDISIMGFDNSEMSERIWPALTTINQPRSDYGTRAVELLIQRIGLSAEQLEKDMPSHVLMEYKLIKRDSTGPKSEVF